MESAKSALASTKRTHAAIKKHEDDGTSPDSQELREWRTVAAAANKELSRMVKKLANQEERHKVEMAMINDEVRGELVDREANNARVAERFRMQLERENSSLCFDRALNSAAVVEASIAALCPHVNGPGQLDPRSTPKQMSGFPFYPR